MIDFCRKEHHLKCSGVVDPPVPKVRRVEQNVHKVSNLSDGL